MPSQRGARALVLIPILALFGGLDAGVHGRLQPAARTSDGVSLFDASVIEVPAEPSSTHTEAIPTPLVRHYKSRGGGYDIQSPLYKMQQEVQRLHKEESFIPPVSTAMKCIINLMTQFFVVYTILFLFQALNRLQIIEREHEENSLARVAETVFFVPMLCIIFIAVRMQAVQFTQGETEKYELPQWWVKAAMVACTFLVMTHTILVFVFTVLVDYYNSISAPTYTELYSAAREEYAASKRHIVHAAGGALRVGRNIVMLGIYLSFSTVVAGVLCMPAPEELWGVDGAPPMNAAIFCTVFLTVLYFIVHLASSVAESAGDGRQTSRVSEVIRGATTTVAFSPMLCSLFLAVRFRALQFDPLNGDFQEWVHWAFYICSFSVLILTVLTVVAPPADAAASHTQVQKVERRGGAECARNITMVCLYAGLFAVLAGLVQMAPAGDGEPVPPLPGTLTCILILANLYFAVYLALWIVMGLEATRPYPTRPQDVLSVLKNYLGVRAKEAVSFCPMFCILFLGTLMRALQLTRGKGAPQDWCQIVEYLSTWAIVLLTAARVDAILPPSCHRLASLCTMLQYVCLCALYAAAIATVVALFTMTPENANGSGSFNPHGRAVVVMMSANVTTNP